MNELLAIIIIVVICCAMFFAWLFSMATCPDRMVNLISGTTNQQAVSSSASSSASKELITSKSSSNSDDGSSRQGGPPKNGASARSSVSSFLQRLNSQRASTNSKKLSVVPEQDEQLTITSISQLRQQNANNRSIQKQPQNQHASILPQEQSNSKSSCRIIMEEEPTQPVVGRTIYLRQAKGHPGVHLLHQPPDNEEDDDLAEERCVEDVIQRRNRRLHFPHLDEDWGPGSNPDSQPITADVTPVPSRTSTNPGSLAMAAAQAENGTNMAQTTQSPCINPVLGASAPAIIHVI